MARPYDETSITTCTNCQKQFHLISTIMSFPVGIERETYSCPYCNQEYKERIRGSFSTKKIENE